MNFKEKTLQLYETIDVKYEEQFGFRIRETNFKRIVEYLHAPKDSSSLAVTRILYGLAMLFDIPDERGGATMALRWGRALCHFPLLPFIQPVPMPYMALVYTALWIGALGIMLGYKYRVTSTMFVICYWYLFLIEKSFWNNHSYLFGLVGLLLSCTEANCFWSMDVYLDPAKSKQTVPYWNYFILKYQFFILYFMAGMKKGTAEWLTGYSVQNIAEHWVFDPFKLFLTISQINYLIVHWFIFIFDLTVAIWMMWARTRHIAMVFCAMFHLMNIRLFRIGMFPWVCLATMPLYYPFDWPKVVLNYLRNVTNVIMDVARKLKNECNCEEPKEDEDDNDIDGDDVFINDNNVINSNDRANGTDDSNLENEEKEHKDGTSTDGDSRKKITTYLLLMYMLTQAFLPYSHFITKGYNNWTDGLYGYSWDMMVHTWDTQSVVVKIVDNESSKEYFIDPSLYTPNDRWTRHGDMVYQYAHCLKKNLMTDKGMFGDREMSANISIYFDIWCSMNGRFTQRLFDPKVDLLQANWCPFTKLSYLMPLLDDAIHWRSTLQKITDDVHSWSNNSEVVFFAEFPNYDQEKYIPVELHNVTLAVLEGVIFYEPEVTDHHNGQSYQVVAGDHVQVNPGLFHKVLNVGSMPAYYMYSFTNITMPNPEIETKVKPKLPVIDELLVRLKGMVIFSNLISKSLIQILFGCSGNCST